MIESVEFDPHGKDPPIEEKGTDRPRSLVQGARILRTTDTGSQPIVLSSRSESGISSVDMRLPLASGLTKRPKAKV